MKPIRLLALLSCVFLLPVVLKAQEKYSKVRVFYSSPESRRILVDVLQLDHFQSENGSIICEVGASEIKKLQRSSFQFEILVDDIVKHLHEQNKRSDIKSKNKFDDVTARMAIDAPGKTVADLIKKPAAFTTAGAMGGFYSYDEMVVAMDNLVGAYPSIAQKFSIGKSIEGRELWCVKISDNVAVDDPEAEVLFTGLQHAREAITGTSLIFFMQYLTENYSTDARIQSLVNNREIFIIPCMNPDGYEQNRISNPSGGGMWRKNKNMTLGDGVDINRNYGVDWGVSGGGSNNPADDTYWGTSAFSEPETKAMRSFVTSRNFSAAIDQHCYGPYYSLPFGFSDRHTMSHVDSMFYSYIPALMGKYNAHRAGDSWETVGYYVAGGIKDWMLLGDYDKGKGKVYGMTGEAGGGGFWAPKAQIISLSQGLCFQNIQLAHAAGSYVDLQDLNDMDLMNSSGSLSYSIRRVGLGNDPVTVTLLPLENIQVSTNTVTVSSLPDYFDTAIRSINYVLPSSVTDGQRVRFIWKTETGGITLYDTITKFYKPQVLFADDMESADMSLKWTLPGSTSGGGGNGNGGGNGGGGNTTSSDNWSYTTSQKYAGLKSLTESPGGNYTGSSSRIVISKTSFNLSDASSAFLSFWVKHRAENSRDKMQVEVSTDSSTWVAISGTTTIQEPGTLDGSTINGRPSLTGISTVWKKEVYDLSAYNGSNKLSLRFNFTSDAANTGFEYQADDGFYIDNVKVMKSTSALSVLPVTFINFSGKLLQDKTIQLNWVATTDTQHSHFEIERSADGSTFINLGKSNAQPPYQFTDPSPNAGNNYYRIKQIEKDGKVSYSKIINIAVAPHFTLQLYPNPVQDVLTVKLTQKQPDALSVQVTDLQGRVVYTNHYTTSTGTSEVKVETKAWSPQVYILKVVNSKNEILATQKFIKK